MKIIVEISGDTAMLETSIKGKKVEWGMKKTGCGEWTQCTENNLDDFFFEHILDKKQLEALENIDLSELQDAFGDEC